MNAIPSPTTHDCANCTSSTLPTDCNYPCPNRELKFLLGAASGTTESVFSAKRRWLKNAWKDKEPVWKQQPKNWNAFARTFFPTQVLHVFQKMYHGMRSHSATIISPTCGNLPNHWRCFRDQDSLFQTTTNLTCVICGPHEPTWNNHHVQQRATTRDVGDTPNTSWKTFSLRSLPAPRTSLTPTPTVTSHLGALGLRWMSLKTGGKIHHNNIFDWFSLPFRLLPLLHLSRHTESWVSLKTSRCNHHLPPTPNDSERSSLQVRNDHYNARFSKRWRKLLNSGPLSHLPAFIRTTSSSTSKEIVFPPPIFLDDFSFPTSNIFVLRKTCVNTTHWQRFSWIINCCSYPTY